MVSETELSVRLPQQIAAAKGIDPTELTPPLYEVVDTEALAATLSSVETSRQAAPATFTFQYDNLSVTVTATEAVDITVEKIQTHRSPSLRAGADD